MGQRKFNPETVSNSHRYNLQTSISNLFLFAFTLVEMAIFCRKKIKKQHFYLPCMKRPVFQKPFDYW